MPLRTWFTRVNGGTFRNLEELKSSFPTVDLIPIRRRGLRRELYVFNIGGNKYRLVAAIHFNVQRIYVRNVLTHSDYDLEGWKR